MEEKNYITLKWNREDSNSIFLDTHNLLIKHRCVSRRRDEDGER